MADFDSKVLNYDLQGKLEELHDIIRACEKIQYKMERLVDMRSKEVVNEYMDLSMDMRTNYERLKYKIMDLRLDG